MTSPARGLGVIGGVELDGAHPLNGRLDPLLAADVLFQCGVQRSLLGLVMTDPDGGAHEPGICRG